jgi:S1-C subfamily serine protease
MRPDIQWPTAQTALPPAPPATRRRTRTRLGPAAVALATAWAIIGALVVQQRLDIDRIREQATRTRWSLDRQISALAGSQASIRGAFDDLFDPAEIVGGAGPSVFTLIAGPWQGSAFVLSTDGSGSALVTNFHVVRGVWDAGVRRVVLRAEGSSFNATIVEVEPEADIAIVKVDADLPSLRPDVSPLRVGESVLALGSPSGFGGTASTGIVSAVRGRYVQFSAPLSPGSSGGPVLDGDGNVVAVATRKVVGRGVEGLSFAVPIDRVCRLTAAC